MIRGFRQVIRNNYLPEDFMAERIVVYGADWCGDTMRTLRHLDRSNVKYDYIDIDNDKAGEEKVIAHSNGRRRIPLVEIASDGGEPQRIAVPRDAELDSLFKKK
jgi:glutaredoxin